MSVTEMQGTTTNHNERGDNTERKIVRAVRSALLIVLSGALVGVATVAFIYLLVFGYYVFAPPGVEQQGVARDLATGWVPATFFVLAVTAAAFLVGFTEKTLQLYFGPLVGVSSTAVMQMLIAFEYPPVLPLEVLRYGMLGVAAGVLGGWLSAAETKRSAAGERALFRALHSIAGASTTEAIAQALGTMLEETMPAGVGVWRTFPVQRDETTNAVETWIAEDSGSFAPERLVEAVGPATSTWKYPRTVLPEMLKAAGRREWEKQGIRSAFVTPLLFVDGKSFGLLLVGFRERRWIIGRTRQRMLSAVAGAAMALEKLSAREEERKKDKQLGVMEERGRLSREIHDSLVQYLSGIARELDSAEMASEASASGMVWQHVDRAREGTQLAAGEARRLIQALRPEALDGSSLPDAFAAILRRFSQESDDIRISSEIDGKICHLPSEAEHALIRITQEALSNVRKHSDATHVDVLLKHSSGCVVLEISDDGIGLDGKPKNNTITNGGFGMRSMYERTERIDARLLVGNSKTGGTKVTVEVPISKEPNKDREQGER